MEARERWYQFLFEDLLEQPKAPEGTCQTCAWLADQLALIRVVKQLLFVHAKLYHSEGSGETSPGPP